jgi:hypothetical protein
MIKGLKVLLGMAAREHPAKKPAPTAKPKPATGGDYRSVSIASSSGCCAAAKSVVGIRYLQREAPRLPLTGCTMPMNCSCKFRKDSDRRDGDRRMFGEVETNRWFAGPEARKCGSRRSTKNHQMSFNITRSDTDV